MSDTSQCLKFFGLDDSSTIEEIKAAYRSAVKKYHPDTGGTTSNSRLFQITQENYEYLLKHHKPRTTIKITKQTEHFFRFMRNGFPRCVTMPFEIAEYDSLVHFMTPGDAHEYIPSFVVFIKKGEILPVEFEVNGYGKCRIVYEEPLVLY